MPINKYKERDLSRMRDMINMESAMFMPRLDDIFDPNRLVKGEMSQCSYGMPSFPEMRGMHSTLDMAMALDSIKRCHNDAPIFHMPHEHLMIDYYDIHEKYSHIPVASICLPVNDIKRSDDDLYLDSVLDNFDSSLIVRSGLYPDSNHWDVSVCRYDEEKVKAYKIPSTDRLDMLARIYKLIKGNKK